jgi:hypothetical protein
VQETLLAALAIQPLVTNVSLVGWELNVYGLLWMLTLLGSFIGLVVNAALLGHLLHCPSKLAWIWLCKITTWSLYGTKVGIPCVVVELGGVCFTKWVMLRLQKTLEETFETS